MITAAKLQSGGCIFLNFFRHKKRDCIKQSLRFSDFSIFLFFYLFHPTIFLSSSFRRMSSLLGLILVYHICFGLSSTFHKKSNFFIKNTGINKFFYVLQYKYSTDIFDCQVNFEKI